MRMYYFFKLEKTKVESTPLPSSQQVSSVSETKPVVTLSMPSMSPEKCCSVVTHLVKVVFELGVLENDRSRGRFTRNQIRGGELLIADFVPWNLNLIID